MIQRSGFYGSLAADGLANTTIGHGNKTVEMHFRLKNSLVVDTMRPFLIVSKPGYAAGTNGQIKIILIGTNLAWTLQGTALGDWPVLRLPYLFTFEAGKQYVLSFTNIDPAPDLNFCSLDSLYINAPNEDAPQPLILPSDGKVVYVSPLGNRTERFGYVPILGLSGPLCADGIGYMEAWVGNPLFHGREVIKPSSPITAYALWFRAIRNTPAKITVGINGVAQFFTFSGISDKDGWLPRMEFATPLVMAPGDVVHVQCDGLCYPLRKGLQQGFPTDSVFRDGAAECSADGITWIPWPFPWSATPATGLADLQFGFEV